MHAACARTPRLARSQNVRSLAFAGVTVALTALHFAPGSALVTPIGGCSSARRPLRRTPAYVALVRRSEQSATAKRCTGTSHYMCRERRAAAVTSLRCLSALQTGVHPDPTDPRKPSEQRLSAGSCVTGQDARSGGPRCRPRTLAAGTFRRAVLCSGLHGCTGVRSAAGRRARRYAGREQPHPHTQVEVQYV